MTRASQRSGQLLWPPTLGTVIVIWVVFQEIFIHLVQGTTRKFVGVNCLRHAGTSFSARRDVIERGGINADQYVSCLQMQEPASPSAIKVLTVFIAQKLTSHIVVNTKTALASSTLLQVLFIAFSDLGNTLLIRYHISLTNQMNCQSGHYGTSYNKIEQSVWRQQHIIHLECLARVMSPHAFGPTVGHAPASFLSVSYKCMAATILYKISLSALLAEQTGMPY